MLQLFAEYLPRPFLVTSRPATELQPGTVNGLRHWHTDYDKGYGTAVKHALLVVGRPRTEFQTGFHPENTLALYDGTELHRGVPAQVAGPRWFVRATYVPEGHPLRKVPRSRG